MHRFYNMFRAKTKAASFSFESYSGKVKGSVRLGLLLVTSKRGLQMRPCGCLIVCVLPQKFIECIIIMLRFSTKRMYTSSLVYNHPALSRRLRKLLYFLSVSCFLEMLIPFGG